MRKCEAITINRKGVRQLKHFIGSSGTAFFVSDDLWRCLRKVQKHAKAIRGIMKSCRIGEIDPFTAANAIDESKAKLDEALAKFDELVETDIQESVAEMAEANPLPNDPHPRRRRRR